MHTTRISIYLLIIGILVVSCAHKTNRHPQFYNNTYVRTCLQIEKQNVGAESRACWSKLYKKLVTQPDFKQRSQFTDSDIKKIHKLAVTHDRGSRKLEDELDVCLKFPIENRNKRIECLKNYKKLHDNDLSLSEKFEIDNSISAMLSANELAAGRVEATLEHAGLLLGAKLHQEELGIRIDAVTTGCLKQAGGQEQGLIVSIEETPIVDLTPSERIAHLDTCQDGPIQILIRYGGLQKITFASLELKCATEPYGKQLSQISLDSEICSLKDSPEIKLGMSWCYLAMDGALKIEQVCADSPAASAGIYPGQLFTGINEVNLLGKTKVQIDMLLSNFPEKPLFLEQKRKSLLSPNAIRGNPLSPERSNACWEAIVSIKRSPKIRNTHDYNQ